MARSDDRPPRFAPARPFPPYSYVSSRHPHPTRDPAGHSFGREEHPDFEPSRWNASETYLYAIDLFNSGYYWEAHEAWEALWIACGRRGPTADLLKGLIKLAAAGVKLREGRPDGVRRHARRAAELIGAAASELAPATDHLGLQFSELSAAALAVQRLPAAATQESGVEPVLGVALWPRPL